MANTKEFTLSDALAIQTEQIILWAEVLNVSTYEKLLAEAIKRNRLTKTPANVFRGTDIDQFIHNIMSEKRNREIELNRGVNIGCDNNDDY